MKVVQINTFSYKATGTIMFGIHHALLAHGYDSYVVWSRGRAAENEREICIADDVGVKLHGIYTRLTDKTGFASQRVTKKLLAHLDKIKPDIIHLHNLHGYYINIEMLFNYIKKQKIKAVWTLHDCWAFTGHCAHFDFVGCDKWKTGCYHCPQKHTYPTSQLLDASSWNWHKKKELFTGLDITLVTPSDWLADLVKQSFLQDYNVVTIHNGIDIDIFKPTPSDFRVKNGLDNRFVILGVASEWTERKGLADFIKLNALLKNDARYKIVLVGLNDRQLKKIPASILGIKRTNSAKELAEIYTAADVYFNASVEETFGMTTVEAIACGVPVIVYAATALPEALNICGNENQNAAIAPGNLDEVITRIRQIQQNEDRVTVAAQEYSKDFCFTHYLKLYRW